MISSSVVLQQKKRLDRRARYVWPLLRPLVKGRLSKRCVRCSLPDAFAKQDDSGVCTECKKFDADPPAKKTETDNAALVAKLDSELRAVQGTGSGPYDAVLMMSGGKDSVYLLHRLRKEYPDLRILSLLVDNNYMSPIAIENAKRVTTALDVEHVTLRLRHKFVSSVFRYVLEHLEAPKNDYPLYGLMAGHMAFDTGRQLAARVGAPLLITGLSRLQNTSAFGDMELPDQQQATREGIPLETLAPASERYHWFEPSKWPADRIPRVISPIAYWNLTEVEIIKSIVAGGLMPQTHISPVLTSDLYYRVFLIAEINRFGYSSIDLQWSQRIRNGTVEKNYWVNVLQMMEYSARSARNSWFKGGVQVARTLGVGASDLVGATT